MRTVFWVLWDLLTYWRGKDAATLLFGRDP
jgi:hypothetical protein